MGVPFSPNHLYLNIASANSRLVNIMLADRHNGVIAQRYNIIKVHAYRERNATRNEHA
jgi:hypothetical protein